MDLFEKLNNIFTEAGKEVEQRAREVSDNVRLNTKIRDEKATIRECMEKIGRLYYEEQQGDGTGIYQEAFDKIHKSQEAIRQAKKELEEYRKKEECQYCGAALRKDDLFCSKCGMKREKPCDDEKEFQEEEREEAATKETMEDGTEQEETSEEAVVNSEKTETAKTSEESAASQTVETEATVESMGSEE